MRIDNNPFLDKHVQYGKETADKLRLNHIRDETTSPGYQRTTVTANDIEPGSRDQLLIRALATDKLSYACTADMPMLKQMESEHLVHIMHKTYHITPLWPRRYCLTAQGKIAAAQAYDRLLEPNTKG